jgi:carbonic anhydrase/acetyltransferase-like protein (isoleucine patch superfamily)
MGSIHDSVFIAPDAQVLGDVTIKEDVGIWFHTTIRGDRASIHIGKGSNVQDNCVIHVGKNQPVDIGEYVTIGHSAVIHGCTIGDNTLIGMGAIVMNGARIGANCIIGAAALVTQDMVVPDGSLILGCPGKIVRKITEEENRSSRENAQMYVEEAKEYRKQERK